MYHGAPFSPLICNFNKPNFKKGIYRDGHYDLWVLTKLFKFRPYVIQYLKIGYFLPQKNGKFGVLFFLILLKPVKIAHFSMTHPVEAYIAANWVGYVVFM